MKLTKTDFTILRWSIFAICASVAISAAILYVSNEYTTTTQKELRKAEKMRNESRKHLAAANEDRDNMSIYADEYGMLISRKIVGDDLRLDWIEGMEKLRQKNIVSDFRYNIAPQNKYVAKPLIDSGNLNINYSEMKLQFDLLHERQLVDFFTALPKTIQGWYQLAGCTLNRVSDTQAGPANSSTTNLKAECTGGWITLKSRSS